MDPQPIIVLWLVMIVLSGVVGTIQLIKGLKYNNNKHLWWGWISLGVCFVLVYIAWRVVSNFGKIGG